MTPSLRRRRLLALASAAAAPIAGCAEEDSSRNNYALPEECSGVSYRLRARPVSTDRNVTANSSIRPSELPEQQRRILDQAIDDELYFECGSPSEELSSFEEIMEQRGERVYVVANDTLYTLSYCEVDECIG